MEADDERHGRPRRGSSSAGEGAGAPGERFDRDPKVARSFASGSAPFPGEGESQGADLRGRRSDPRDYGRGQHESGGHDPYRHPGDQPDWPRGYGGYGSGRGEAGAGFGSGQTYAAEPGWGPGYGTQHRASGAQNGPARRGRGPKNYRRSDERVREDLCERLLLRDDIDASEVNVDVKDGIVTLEGAVPERRMKHAIEDVADACAGVTDIDNRIRVTYGEHGSVHAQPARHRDAAAISIGGAGGTAGSSTAAAEGPGDSGEE